MKVDMGIWNRLPGLMWFVLIVAALIGALLLYVPLIRQRQGTHREAVRLENKNRESEEKIKKLKSEIEAIRNDPRTVDRLVRERMSYAKTNETVIRFEPAQNNQP